MDKLNYILVEEEYYILPNIEDNDALTRYFLISASPSLIKEYLINEVLKDQMLVPWTFSDVKETVNPKTLKGKDILNYLKNKHKEDKDISILINYIIKEYNLTTNQESLYKMANAINQTIKLIPMPLKSVKYFNDESSLNLFLNNNNIKVLDKNKITL